MLKLKLQYLGHLMRRVDSLEESDAGRDWRQEEKGTGSTTKPQLSRQYGTGTKTEILINGTK